jgi:hypothetical protein
VSGNSSITRGRGIATPGREVFRLATPVVLWWVWVVFAMANVVDLAVQGSAVRSALRIDAILLVVTGVAYVLAFRPRVMADQAGLTIVNPFRDHHVPWAVIQGVDTGDWVRVHHAPDGNPDVPGQAIECWALYVSARAKRKGRGAPPPRVPGGRGTGRLGFFGMVKQPVDETPRAPEEAKYLASLPPATAIAVQLDNRAAKERARGARPGPVTARWDRLPVAVVVVPVLVLLIVALA